MADFTGDGGTRAGRRTHRTRSPLRRAFVSAGALVAAMVAAAGAAAPAVALAPDRAYEMVSPVDTAGHGTSTKAVSPDGSRVLMVSGGGYAGTPSLDGAENNYLGLRGSDGWLTRPLNMPGTVFEWAGTQWDSTSDLSEHLLIAPTHEENAMGGSGFYLVDGAGGRRRASPPIFNLTRPDDPSGFLVYVAGAAELDRFVFTTSAGRPVLPTDAVEGTSSAATFRNVYEVYDARSDEPKVRRVDVDNDGNVIGFGCGRIAGGDNYVNNLISEDGRTIFFSGRTPPVAGVCAAATRGPYKVFARLDGASTVEISASECDRVADPGAVPPVAPCAVVPTNAPAASDALFRGASTDGTVAIFSTNRQLTDSDTDATDDLYEYRRNPPSGEGHLTQVTAAPGQSATPGNGARHLGVVQMSDDGKRIYFVAQGVLTEDPGAGGSTAVNGANNLYLFERTAAAPEGRVRFIATLAATSDPGLWGNENAFEKRVQFADATGRFMVFSSVAQLAADDTDAVADVYRYDADGHALVRVSHGKDGYATDGNGPIAATVRQPFAAHFKRAGVRSITADGAGIVFLTAEALQEDDINGIPDVYEWREGHGVELVTDGTGPMAPAQFGETITPDGGSIIFATLSRLTPRDVDGAGDVYVARRGGGFAFPPPLPADVCVGDDCQGPASPPPGAPGIGSVAFGGDGNRPLAPKRTRASVGISKLRAVAGSSARLRVRVPDAGRISLVGSSIRRSQVSAWKAGSYTVRVALSAKAKKALRKRKRLKVSARVSYRARDGQSATKAISVTFKQPKSKRAKKGGR